MKNTPILKLLYPVLFLIISVSTYGIERSNQGATVIVKRRAVYQGFEQNIQYFNGVEGVRKAIYNAKHSDTLSVESTIWPLEVVFEDSYAIPSLLVNRFDTVIVNFKDNVPYFELAHASVVLHENGWMPKYLSRYKAAEDSTLYFFQYQAPYRKVRQAAYTNWSILRYCNSVGYLDSLIEKGGITPYTYRLQRANFTYLASSNALRPSVKKDLTPSTLSAIPKVMLNDSLLILKSYRNFLIWHTTYREGIYKSTPSGLAISYTAAFTNTLSDTTLPVRSQSFLLYYLLNGIRSSSSAAETERYTSIFKKQVKDSTYLALLDSRLTDAGASTSLSLLDRNRQPASLESLRKKFRGKAIYVDIWASWCAPCRASMPSSNQLRKEYEGKDVVFVYLSIDENAENWQRAVKDVSLAGYPYSYIVSKTRSSSFLKSIQLKSVPRYLLFDRNGKLVNRNAKGPEDNSVQQEIGMLLKR